MTTRAEHLAWCKERALAIAASGDIAAAVASMGSDLLKFDGPPIYDAECYRVVMADGMIYRNTIRDVTNWINGCT